MKMNSAIRTTQPFIVDIWLEGVWGWLSQTASFSRAVEATDNWLKIVCGRYFQTSLFSFIELAEASMYLCSLIE